MIGDRLKLSQLEYKIKALTKVIHDKETQILIDDEIIEKCEEKIHRMGEMAKQ